MSEFSPEDGVVFFAWRNTFHRISERTYDWLYVREAVLDADGDYAMLEVPFQADGPGLDWVRVIQERTFDSEERVTRFVSAMERRYAKEFGNAEASPLRIITAHHKAPQASIMYYDNGTLVLPAHSKSDAHSDPDGDPINRERFIASRWMDFQRGWPIAEHHVLHELAHHISGSDNHEAEFVEVFRHILSISAAKTMTDVLWDKEWALASGLLTEGEPVVDMVTGSAFNADGTLEWQGAFASA